MKRKTGPAEMLCSAGFAIGSAWRLGDHQLRAGFLSLRT
jgi:hypothetical protein